MKLLILGLILIGIVLIQIYYVNKNRENFESELDKALVDGERQFMAGQDKYWNIRSQGIGSGLITTKPDINEWVKLDENKNLQKYVPKNGLDQRDIDTKIVNCRALTKCEQLTGKNGCGYCAMDKEFRFGTKDGPTADVCPKNAWSTDAGKCQELREKEICSNVQSCGDLYGEAAKICGYCPTTGKAMVMEKVGEKYFPKYSDDTCDADGFGLLPGDKCGKFLKDHPCITPYYLSGPHPEECVKKLWKNSNCTDSTPYGKSFKDLGKVITMPYKEAGIKMLQTNTETRSSDYNTAVNNSDICFGNNDNIDPCDPKYSKNNIPHPACLRKEFKEAGCNEQGKGWALLKGENWNNAKKQVSQVSKYSKAQNTWSAFGFKYPFSTETTVGEYKSTMKRVNKLTVEADDYNTRAVTSMHCFGSTPPAPPPIKPGDTVSRIIDSNKYEGLVTRMSGADCYILWTQGTNLNNNNVTKREGTTINEQKQMFGWDGIPPTKNPKLKTIVNKARLNLKTSCSNNKSTCKLTCKDKIQEVLFKYPRPRDCMVGPWDEWSSCNKPCGGGESIRHRKITYPAKFGGSGCPVLENRRVCNMNPCMNVNFTEKV
uniref:Spondin-like TSP1 domain-containing protein n=1 Tax=viral metagenome TaxID=1070528 RepID=A0A6C0JEU4_9ZZZZ|tara:strand:+ start:13905 stop:15704 length:1800 start_codon:yes stop_codon:yes gene_type:complete